MSIEILLYQVLILVDFFLILIICAKYTKCRQTCFVRSVLIDATCDQYNNQSNTKAATMRVKNSKAILGPPLTIPVVAVCVVLS